jgi:hypothetical protein
VYPRNSNRPISQKLIRWVTRKKHHSLNLKIQPKHKTVHGGNQILAALALRCFRVASRDDRRPKPLSPSEITVITPPTHLFRLRSVVSGEYQNETTNAPAIFKAGSGQGARQSHLRLSATESRGPCASLVKTRSVLHASPELRSGLHAGSRIWRFRVRDPHKSDTPGVALEVRP